jgi:hypothetical protein
MDFTGGSQDAAERYVRNNKSKLLVVDVHLDTNIVDDGKPVAEASMRNGLPVTPDGDSAIMGEVKYHKILKRCRYRVGSWNVYFPWPWDWKCPGPNRLGWLPSAEFGVPTMPGETAMKDSYLPVEPFTYTDNEGNQYTPPKAFPGVKQ